MLRLKYQKGRTINLGNFESERIDIGIECEFNNEYEQFTRDEVFADLKSWVESKLAEESNGKRQFSSPD